MADSKREKSAWLDGATDLEERDVEVNDQVGSVRVRALSAGQLSRITDECLTMKGESMKVDSRRMSVLKFKEGVIDPQFTVDEANVIAQRFGRAFSLVVGVIDELSKADEAAVAKAAARFPA